MQPRINIITLGVTNLDFSRKFYEAMGFKASPASQGDVVFFSANGVVLALYPSQTLAEDAGVDEKGEGFRRFTLAQNVSTKEEVSQILEKAKSAGAKVIKPAQDVFWGGHSGYFADPDGFLWEIAWNPHFPLDQKGSIQLP